MRKINAAFLDTLSNAYREAIGSRPDLSRQIVCACQELGVLRQDDSLSEPESWITVNGTHVPVNGERELLGSIGEKISTGSGKTRALSVNGMKRVAASYGKWAKQLTNKERAAVQKFVSQHSRLFNDKLRKGKDVPRGQATKAEYEALDSALEKSSIPENVCVFRGTSLKLFGGQDPKSLVGKQITDSGYMSTSMSKGVADIYSGDVVCKINCNAGSRGAYVDEVGFGEKSDFGVDANNEILLPRGSKFEVKSVSKRNGKWEVEMDYIG